MADLVVEVIPDAWTAELDRLGALLEALPSLAEAPEILVSLVENRHRLVKVLEPDFDLSATAAGDRRITLKPSKEFLGLLAALRTHDRNRNLVADGHEASSARGGDDGTGRARSDSDAGAGG